MALRIKLKVTPRAGKQLLIIDKNGDLKCYLKNIPEDGAANRELIKFLATLAGVRQADVTIIRGFTARIKEIEINTLLSYEELMRRAGCEVQGGIF